MNKILNKQEDKILEYLDKGYYLQEENDMCKQLERLGTFILSKRGDKLRKEDGILNKKRMEHIQKKECVSLDLVYEDENNEDVDGYNIGSDKPNNNRIYKSYKVIKKDNNKYNDIDLMTKFEKNLKGNNLREMRADKKILKKHYNPYIEFSRIGFYSTKYNKDNIFPQTFADIIDFEKLDEDNKKQIHNILKYYSDLKQFAYEEPDNDISHILRVIEDLIENVGFPDYLKDILIWNIDKLSLNEIKQKLQVKYGLDYSEEYIAKIWTQIIPDKIYTYFKNSYEDWLYTYKLRGKWKTCSKCGEVKLANERYFSKDSNRKDELDVYCKECRKSGKIG